MTKELFETIRNRVNAAANLFAGTEGINYCAHMTASEVMATDRENREDLPLFPELEALGY